MPAPPVVLELIERFRENRESFLAKHYNEAQARRELIDPLFETLGWDISNKKGYADAYKDVIHEDKIKISGTSKAPDYAFRVGGTRKFFLEAKKPSINIENDAEAAYQLRRYGWSAKLPLSILTNFETTVIYDCRIKPEHADKASTARLLILKYDELQNRWDELAGIFGLDAVLRGSFDRFAQDNRRKRGTTTVDDAFLEQIELWRDELARAIFRKNRSLATYQLNDAVQKIIDRIVFLRIAEDRGIEQYQRLNAISREKDVYGALRTYFRQADDRYNSGLFHFRKGDGSPETLDGLTLSLDIDNKPLKEVLQSLYYPKSPYEFSVIPSDILGQVYERFLGRTIRIDGRSIVIEEKPEIKKAGGVYYTPTFVVRHIVRETLASLLDGRSPAEISGEKPDSTPIRVLDPACGSGSFLIEAYQHLLDWYFNAFMKEGADKHSRGRRPKLYRDDKGRWRLSIAERRRILTSHIFGVDIDPQAVEVAKLSLLLKVLEGETNDAIAAQADFFNRRVLPDLGNNIKCGNTLIGHDFYGMFNHEDFDEDAQRHINSFSWSREFPEPMKMGFDIVLGNPPYGALLSGSEKQYIIDKYPNQSYQLDSYLLFFERSLEHLLKDDGLIGFIIPNPWLTNILQGRARQWIFSRAAIKQIVHFTFPVFAKAKATVDTEIVIARKGGANEAKPVAYIVSELEPDGSIKLDEKAEIEHSQRLWRDNPDDPVNIFLRPEERALALKIRNAGRPLGTILRTSVGMKPYQVGKGRPKQTRADVEGRIFDSDMPLTAEHRPYLRGADIERFIVAPLEKRFIAYGVWLAEPRLSAGFDAPQKIVLRQTGDSLVAAIDENGYLCMNNMHVAVPLTVETDLYFILGLLNSKLMNWYYQALNPEVGEALAEVKKTNIDRLPIPIVNNSDTKTISGHANAVSEIISILRSTTDEVGRRSLQRKLDVSIDLLNQSVYKIFGLSSDEVTLIEASQAAHVIR